MTSHLFVGIDVSAAKLDVCVIHAKRQRFVTFDNTPQGHRALRRRKSLVKVVVESTGVYHLEVAFTLHQAEDICLYVVNPRQTKHFAKALDQRSKSDQKDARTLALFAKRMVLVPWSPPGELVLKVRSLTRRMEQLQSNITRERNRLHALEHAVAVSSFVLEQMRCQISRLECDVQGLESEAVRLVKTSEDSKANEQLKLLCTMPGVALRTALVLWSELSGLPSDMGVRQWVAHCGLDVCQFESGSSVRGPERISKKGNRFVRRVLYLSALSAPKACEAVARYRQELLDRDKAPKVAAVAVMRKLLHSVFGILKNGQPFDPEKFRARAVGAG